MARRFKNGGAVLNETVFLVLDRDRDRCARCYALCEGDRGWDWSIQHRIPRGMGGTSRPELGLTGNLVLLCGSATTGCHGYLETTAAGRQEGAQHGWCLSKFTSDPTGVPVSLWDRNGRRITVYIDNDGGMSLDPLEIGDGD